MAKPRARLLRLPLCPVSWLALLSTALLSTAWLSTAWLSTRLITTRAAMADDVGPSQPAEPSPLAPRQACLADSIDATLRRASQQPGDLPAQLDKIDALLAVGRVVDAEQSARQTITAIIAADTLDNPLANTALKLWLTARLRQGLPLESTAVDALVARLGDRKSPTNLRAWQRLLAGAAPYRTTSDATRARVPLESTRLWSHLAARRVEGVGAIVDGLPASLVFIDTGAQYTVVSPEFAASAGLQVTDEKSQMLGFAAFPAAPSLIRQLRIGDLSLANVPVIVGSSAGLSRNRGQMALGIDVLYHLRVVVDPRQRQVTIEPSTFGARAAADAASVNTASASTAAPLTAEVTFAPNYEIPIWTFADACVAEARLANDVTARVLIDTGDWQGSFVSTRWARGHDELIAPARARLGERFDRRRYTLSPFSLAGRACDLWPIRDLLPPELDRLDRFDFIVGQDWIGRAPLTIDLAGRMLRLVGEP